jgi:cytochrome c oxidase subunit III
MTALRIIGDVAHLPDHGNGSAALGWWGTLGFVLIEGMAFVLAIGALLYLLPEQPAWPPASPPPDLLYGTLFTAIIVLSEIPNFLAGRVAMRHDVRAVRIVLVVMSAIGLVLAAVRAFEFGALNVLWTDNAYGSIVWALMLMHTVHIGTDVFDTLVLTVLVFVRKVDGRRLSDVEDNAFYWHFVTIAWLVLYVLIYLLPRFISRG